MWVRVGMISLVLLLATGCETMEVLSFRSDPRSGVAGEAVTTLDMVDRSTADRGVWSRADGFPGLAATMKERCQAVAEVSPTVAVLAPVAGVVAGLIVESAVKAASEALQDRVDALKQASRKGYSGMLIMDDARSLGGSKARVVNQCLLLTRRLKSKDGDEVTAPAAAYLIGVVPHGTNVAKNRAAVVFLPLYVHIDQAAAVTRNGQTIDAAVGLSVVVIVDGKSGPERREISLGAFQLSGIAPGKTRKLDQPSAGTGLMAMPPSTSAALELRVAVVETGSALPDFDKSKAEIQAVRDALGPAIKDAVVKSVSVE